MFSKEQDSLFEVLAQCAGSAGLPIFVVGGTIRDLFLGKNPADRDIDFLIEGDATVFSEKCVAVIGGELKRFPDFYTAKIIGPIGYSTIDEVDLASARTEIYKIPGALPTVSLASIRDDLKRRDFTINAMAAPLNKLIEWGRADFGNLSALKEITLDYFKGAEDLTQKVVRIIHDNSFIDDPTRIFRGVRYAVRLGGKLAPETEALIKSGVQKGVIATISKNRALNEIKKMAFEKGTQMMIGELERLGVMWQLGFYETAGSELVRNYLTRLDSQYSQIGGENRYQTLLKIFFAGACAGTSLDSAQALYLRLGFGKKEVSRMIIETSEPPSDLRRVSDAGIIFQSISKGPSDCDKLNGELKSRGIL